MTKNFELILIGILVLWLFLLKSLFSKKKPVLKKTNLELKPASQEEEMMPPPPPRPPNEMVEKALLEKKPPIRKKFLNKKNLRQALIVSEILKNPDLD